MNEEYKIQGEFIVGAEFTDLTWEDMCDLMCGKPEEDYEEDMEGGEN